MMPALAVAPELERRILASPRLPSLPAVALEVLRLCHADEIDLWKIADALSTDPSLAARVLRAANSASLAARGKVGTLARAVPLLGSNAVVALALSFALVRGRRREDGGFDRSAFWRRAVFSALASRTLAEAAEDGLDPEEAFLAALLQDIGMLALAEVFPREYGELCTRAGGEHEAVARLERELWQADHASVGALLTRTWRLPPLLQHAVGGSHLPPDPSAPANEAHFLRCVALSGLLADIWTAPGEGGLRPALESARTRLGLGDAELEGVLARMALAIPETAGDFDIDLGGPAQVDAVLAEARRLPAALGVVPAAPEPGARVESGEALEGALRLAFDYARTHGETMALLLAVPDVDLPPERAAALVGLLRRCVRTTDLLGPGGAGEVLILLPETELSGAKAVAGRLLARISAGGPRLPLSIGVAAGRAGGIALERLRADATARAAEAHERGGSQVAAVHDPSPGGKP